MYGYVAYIRYKFRAKHERMSNNSLTNCAKRRDMGFFSRSSKSAFSRHDNVQSSSTSLIWPTENVLFSFLEKCVFSPWQCPSKLDIAHLA